MGCPAADPKRAGQHLRLDGFRGARMAVASMQEASAIDGRVLPIKVTTRPRSQSSGGLPVIAGPGCVRHCRRAHLGPLEAGVHPQTQPPPHPTAGSEGPAGAPWPRSSPPTSAPSDGASRPSSRRLVAGSRRRHPEQLHRYGCRASCGPRDARALCCRRRAAQGTSDRSPPSTPASSKNEVLYRDGSLTAFYGNAGPYRSRAGLPGAEPPTLCRERMAAYCRWRSPAR